MFALLGRVLWFPQNMDALHLLLLCRLPLQNCPPILQRNLPEVRQVRQDSQTRATLYQPMHINFRHDQLQDSRLGSSPTGTSETIQNVITKDNVSINIDTAVYYKVINPRYAYYRVQNFSLAIAEVTYAILKNTCGQFVLQDLLEKRQEIADDIEKQVDQYIEEWGVDVNILQFRSKKSSSRISSLAKTSRKVCHRLPKKEDWPKAKFCQLRQMFKLQS